uniref:BK_channel_a domain-containing protein n=1 Tax=Globodera pallida TaxID=36090 RepID=A0A183BWF5_GLOPA
MRQLRDSMARQVCLMIINRPEDGHDLATYMNCFERYNQGRQVGVLDFADHPTIEDGYVFTLSAGVALPAALLPLDGAGLPEWAKHNESIVLVLICRMDHEDYKAHSERLLQAHSRGHCAIWEQQQLLKHGGGGLPPCGGRHLYPYRDRQRSKPDHQRLNTGGETGDDDKSETDHNHHNSNHNNRSAANSPSVDQQQDKACAPSDCLRIEIYKDNELMPSAVKIQPRMRPTVGEWRMRRTAY